MYKLIPRSVPTAFSLKHLKQDSTSGTEAQGPNRSSIFSMPLLISIAKVVGWLGSTALCSVEQPCWAEH
jgi:hypothetical protein